MNLFETVAHAADAGAPPPDAGFINLLFLGGFVLIFYFLLWRPQSKRRKEHQTLMQGLQKGDEVVTAGGLVGVINKVEEGTKAEPKSPKAKKEKAPAKARAPRKKKSPAKAKTPKKSKLPDLDAESDAESDEESVSSDVEEEAVVA